MIKIIETFVVSDDERSLWIAAAMQWRLPYWNWGIEQPYSKKYGVAHIFTLPKLEILIPGSGFTRKESWDNPLNKFSNPEGTTMGDRKMGNFRIPEHKDGDDTFPVRKQAYVC